MLTRTGSKRHLAQETKGNNDKSTEEVKKTKSYASLNNWGHDFLKARGENKKADADEHEDEGQDADEEIEEDQKKAGDKRKTSNGQSGSVKKIETRKGESKTKDDKVGSEEVSEEDEDGDDEDANDAEKSNGRKANGKKEDSHAENGAKSKNGPQKGDTVSWNWGGGRPEGKVLDVKGEK